MVSHPFSAFEKEGLEVAKQVEPSRSCLGRRPGSHRGYEAEQQTKRRGHDGAMLKVKLDRIHDVFLYATQYGYGVGSTLIERVLRFSGVSTGLDGKRVALMLLESNYDACSLSLSLSPLVRKEAYARDAKDEQLTFLWRLVDISDSATTMTSPKPGDDSFTNNNLSRLHLFRLLVNEPISYNHVQGDDMRDSNPTFSCCLARVAVPCQVQQPETAPLSGPKRSFFPLLFLLLIIEEQRWNFEQQVSEV